MVVIKGVDYYRAGLQVGVKGRNYGLAGGEEWGFDANEGVGLVAAPMGHRDVDGKVMSAKLPSPDIGVGRLSEEGEPVVLVAETVLRLIFTQERVRIEDTEDCFVSGGTETRGRMVGAEVERASLACGTGTDSW